MTVTSAELGTVVEAAGAVIRSLPVADLTPGEPSSDASALEQSIPGPGSKAVTATLNGAVTGQIYILVSAELAAQIENGPVGPQDLVAGLDVALTDATTALANSLGDLRHEVAQSLDADIAFSNLAQYEQTAIVPVMGAAGPVASVVVMLNFPGEAAGEETAASASFETLSSTMQGVGALRGVELLSDVEMGVTAELGRTRMTVRELLGLQPGSVVELDRAAGSPVDLLVNGTLVARGEVVVIDEEFGVRITEIIGYDAKGK